MPESQAIDKSAIWTRLWEKLVLTAGDQKKLQSERGFADEVISKLGFRTSQAQNRAIIDSLADDFPVAQLERLGILVKGDDGYFANGIFCGWGPTGDYVKNADGSFKLDRHSSKIRERKQGVNPILIPYLDAGGKVETLRPHKDNVRRPDAVDDLDEDYTGLSVYCPHILRTVSTSNLFTDAQRGFCVLTEGEYKATALFQAGIPALAMPGIQSARNGAFRRKLVQLLKDFQITDVVICFDNEIKDDPAFPNYKADEWDRVDTIVYARYTAATLYREGIKSTKIANLPDDWRVRGKADWDSSLARFVNEAGGDIHKGTVNARREFLKVLRGARIEQDCRDLFASTLHRIIEAKLARLYHVPMCPIGGDNERRLGWKIKKLQDVPGDEDYRLQLGQAFVNVQGVHYTRKPIKKWKDDEFGAIKRARDTARQTGEWARYNYYKELIAGLPFPISNFAARCNFRLVSSEGRIEYLLNVRNIHNERTEQHVRITADELCRRTEFHKWAIANVRGSWAGGEKDSQALMMDFQAQSAFREIHEIDTYGYSDKCNLWKFADRAFTPDGKMILPDKDMVFWYNGIGYQTDFDKQRIGDGFSQGAPTLGELDVGAAIDSFILFAEHLKAAVGDYGGWLAVGAILAYAVHPEIFRTYMGVPGLWFTGRRGGGKSTIAEWLIQIWGFNAKLNISLGPDTTYTSIGRELSKYGCLSLPFDEFDATQTDPRVQEMLKNAFTRLSGRKATFDGTKHTRGVKPETTPFVLGENSSRNSATRSRYINLSILDEKSFGDKKARLLEMNKSAHLFPNIGHFIMKNRSKFAELVLDQVNKWVDDPVVAKFVPRIRERFISGLPMAAFISSAMLLRDHANEEAKQKLTAILDQQAEFHTFAMEHGSESQKEVTDTSYVNTFWQDVLNIIQTGGTHVNYRRFFSLKYADIDEENRIKCSKDHHGPDMTPVMFMAYDSAYHIYSQEIRKAGKEARLSITDLARELKREKYWVRPKKDESHKMSIEGVGRPVCWVFDLTEHPLGEELIDALDAKTAAARAGGTNGSDTDEL